MKDLILNFIDFYKKAEKLKSTTRHSWLTNSSRQESVAEHTWMLCLLAMLLSDKLDKKADLLKVLKMLLIHDLAESVTGDIPSHEVSLRQQNKHDAEKVALQNIIEKLPENKAREIISLWEEFEENKSHEAQFANSLDKIEVLMQHNLADISTWEQGDFNVCAYYKNNYFDFDSFMRLFKDVVDNQTMEKLIETSTISRISPEHLEIYNKSKKP